MGLMKALYQREIEAESWLPESEAEMNLYTTKTLIPGFKLGQDFIGKTYVGVPHKYAERGYNVAHKNQMMTLPQDPDTISKPLKDKFGRGVYFLYYYEWKPKKLTIGEFRG